MIWGDGFEELEWLRVISSYSYILRGPGIQTNPAIFTLIWSRSIMALKSDYMVLTMGDPYNKGA